MSKLLDDLAKPDPLSVALAVTSTNHILINTEGKVHSNTYLHTRNTATTRQPMISENKVRPGGYNISANSRLVKQVGESFPFTAVRGERRVQCCHFQLNYCLHLLASLI